MRGALCGASRFFRKQIMNSHLSRTGHKHGEFPKTKYAPSGGSVVVDNATEERALGPGWSDNPQAPAAADENPPAAPAKPAKNKKAAKKEEANGSENN